ncbi:LysR family transcriptional regulator [Marinobacter sp. M5B]|uniref:LysR family transcriptional regulator n=1 Tax=Marinobacter sp. M5B TaxID=3141535 RepID=UPI0036D3AEF8
MYAMSFTDTPINTEKLNSDLLRTFLAVAETGSFSRAAERIFRSQSAVSLQIKQLENSLGQAAFQRLARGVVLTPAGEKLFPFARKIVGLLDEAIGELKGNQLQGSIRIGIPDEYGGTLLPGVIAQFSRDHPQVELSVRCSLSASFPEALAKGEIDIAVYAVEAPLNDALLLRREKTHWVTSKNHLIHEQKPVPLALFDRTCWWRDRAIEALDRSEKNYQVSFSSESVTGIAAAVSAGVAVGVLGESSLRDDFRVLTLVDGFPSMPDSSLVLEQREGASEPLLKAMSDAIKRAFGTHK